MRYLIHYPRNFCNEYAIYVGDKATLDKLVEILGNRRRAENANTQFITRRRAIQLGVSRVNEAKRDGEQWFGGFAETGTNYETDLTSVIADAAKATEAEVWQAEASAEAEAAFYAAELA